MARVGGLNPRTELVACLDQLQQRRLISCSSDGSVSVLGINGRTALGHAADILEDNDPQPFEYAAIGLAELTSSEPIRVKPAAELIGDTYELAKAAASDFLNQACTIGFVDAEGEGEDRLLFNGYLFRRDTAAKTKKVLDSLNSTERVNLREFAQLLGSSAWQSREGRMPTQG